MQEPSQLNPQMPALDLDVLDTICAFLTEYPDLLSLSLTCSVLRPIAIRSMLRNRPVVLKNVDTICKFHDFVFSDAIARLHHITSLRIDVSKNATHPMGSERAIDCLLAILGRTPSLTSLELHSSANGGRLGYLDNPRLATAIKELGTLREFTICGRTKAADFTSAALSPLKKLSIRFMYPPSAIVWDPDSLTAALSHLANCLQSLSIRNSAVQLIPPRPPPDRILIHTQFHALRSLTLNTPMGILHLPVLLKLFPNLNGTLYLVGYPVSGKGPEEPDFFEATRKRNGAAQEQRSWKRLERLICAVETLFILNLRSQIGLTIVESYMADPDGRPSRYFLESLRTNPPTRLNVQVPLSIGGQHQGPLGGMISPEAAEVLTHLTLCINYRYQDPEYWPAMRLEGLWHDTLRPVLLDLHVLTHLRFIFHCEVWTRKNPASVADDAFLRDLRPASFDFIAIAHSCVDAIPSLRYCFLTTSARVAAMLKIPMVSVVEQWCDSRAWRVAACEGSAEAGTACGRGRELVELHNDVAGAIIAEEDLGLSTEEEEAMNWR